MNHSKTERGQALILIVLAMIAMLALTATAVDAGLAYTERRQAQNVADAAVLDAALAKARGQNDWQQQAQERAASNGFNNNGATNTVEVHSPPVPGCGGQPNPYVGNTEYVQVIIRSVTRTSFGRAIGVQQVNHCVEAIARARPPSVQPLLFGNAIVALKPNQQRTFWMHGNPRVRTVGGGVFVNSSTNCGFTSNGVPDLITPSITMVASQSCPQMVGPGIVYNAPQVPYPPNFNLPRPTCTQNATKVGNTLNPGRVNGSFPPSGVTHLNPGVYCVNGSFSLNGNDTLIGHEVVIYMESGNIRWNGNGALHLSAPTSGPFKGLLIYFPITNNSEIRINGTNDQLLKGTILAPASNIVLLGTANTDSYRTQIIGYTVEIGGTFDGIVRYNDEENYDATVPPMIELVR